jgi:hypothetical protein
MTMSMTARIDIDLSEQDRTAVAYPHYRGTSFTDMILGSSWAE